MYYKIIFYALWDAKFQGNLFPFEILKTISDYIFTTHKKWLIIQIDGEIIEINRIATADVIRSQIQEHKNAIKLRREESLESLKTCFSDFSQIQGKQIVSISKECDNLKPLASSKSSLQEIPQHEISETKEKELEPISKEDWVNSFVPACLEFSSALLDNPDPLIQSMGRRGIYLNLGYLSK